MKVLGLLIAAFAITFHALIHLAEIFHGVEYLHTLLKPLIDLSPETTDAVLDGGARRICLCRQARQ